MYSVNDRNGEKKLWICSDENGKYLWKPVDGRFLVKLIFKVMGIGSIGPDIFVLNCFCGNILNPNTSIQGRIQKFFKGGGGDYKVFNSTCK